MVSVTVQNWGKPQEELLFWKNFLGDAGMFSSFQFQVFGKFQYFTDITKTLVEVIAVSFYNI